MRRAQGVKQRRRTCPKGPPAVAVLLTSPQFVHPNTLQPNTLIPYACQPRTQHKHPRAPARKTILPQNDHSHIHSRIHSFTRVGVTLCSKRSRAGRGPQAGRRRRRARPQAANATPRAAPRLATHAEHAAHAATARWLPCHPVVRSVCVSDYISTQQYAIHNVLCVYSVILSTDKLAASETVVC